MNDSFFLPGDNNTFLPTDHTRGPWHQNHCHAGPPTGLLARAVELLFPDQRLTRLTVNLTRPIPHAPMSVEAQAVRQGRIVSTASAELRDPEQRICATATALLMSPQPENLLPTHAETIGQHSEATEGPFPIQQTLHELPAFNGSGVETKYPPGENADPGVTTAWLKTVPLIDGETPSPFQKICPLADCGNAFGRNAEPDAVNFMNPDLTILLHRDPVGDWFGTRSAGYWESNGIGMADAQLFDGQGAVGRALQTLLLRPS